MDRRRGIAIVALVIAGCSTSGEGSIQSAEATQAGDATQAAEAWIATDGSSAMLLRWTEGDAKQISGALQLAELVDNEVEGRTWPIEGVVGDGEITLTVEGLFGTGSTVTGDHADGRLTLYWPQDSGSMSAVSFSSGTIADYNEAVEALRQSGADAAEWEEQAEFEADAISEADNRVASARTNLERAIGDFYYDRDWASYSIDSVQYALDALDDAVVQLEDTLSSAPEWADADLDWAESSYVYLQDEADYALGPDGLGVIEDSLAALEATQTELEVAIEDLRYTEDLYLNSEFGPYDASDEEALMEEAETIIRITGPAAIAEHRTQVDDRLAEGVQRIEYARSLMG